MFMTLIPLALQFPAMVCSVSAEAADMQCWHYFSYTYFWFGYLASVTCSRSQDLTCFLCIICSPLSKSRSILPIAPGLLHSWHHLMLFCFAVALICFWINLIVQFSSEFSLSCIDLCKVSTEDSYHIIS